MSEEEQDIYLGKSIFLSVRKHTREAFEALTPKLLVGFCIFVIALALRFVVFGRGSAMDKLWDSMLYVVVPVVVLTIVAFMWNLWLAPFRLLSGRLEAAINSLNPVMVQDASKEPEQADFRKWDKVQTFKIWQVAYLMCGLSPVQAFPQRTDAVRASFSQLEAAVNTGQLKTHSRDRQKSIEYQRVSRKDLGLYFSECGEVPEFLK